MSTNAARRSQNRVVLVRAKNEEHTCRDCGAKVGRHPLGRSAHDRMAIHVATTHRKWLDRECRGGECVASPFTPRERRG